MWQTKMHFSAKCNSGRIAIQWFHIKHYLDYQYTKFQPFTFRVQKMCVFARYATLVPRLLASENRSTPLSRNPIPQYSKFGYSLRDEIILPTAAYFRFCLQSGCASKRPLSSQSIPKSKCPRTG